MRTYVVSAATLAAAVLAGCTPEIEQVPPTDVAVARFDPSLSPPVVPTPNDLAFDPESGTLRVTPVEGASPADLEFVAWLNTLNGFPASTSGGATFTAELDPASLSESSVRVFDVTDDHAPVAGTTLSLTEPAASDGEDAKAKLQIAPPPGGWTPAHTYAIALISGEGGLRSADGKPLVGSATWALIRSANPLVTCEDLTSEDCRAATEVIPSGETDPAARVADQAAKAIQLERLRLKYKPTIDALIASGVKREDIVLVWTFRVHGGPIALFNPAATPPQVPTPNDLAIDPATGLVNAPIDPDAPPAQQEFTRDYLNTLDGFPVSADGDATVIGGALDPSTVNAASVRVVDLSLGENEEPVIPNISWDAARGHIVISPPESGWVKGHRYAIALTADALAGDGTPLASGDVWALARSPAPLVDCEDLGSADCRSVLKMAPVSDAQAVALEGLRRSFKPVLDMFEATGVERTRIVLMWTFRVVGLPEATFDPANGVIPFPNNLLLDASVNPPKVNLPIPDGASPLQIALISGLNTLDGFSTIGPYVSENSKTAGALDRGLIDESTLAAGTGFVALTPGVTEPQVSACLNCQSSPLPDGSPQTSPQQLQFITHVPLDERATYAAWLTDALRNDEGKKVVAAPPFALIRMENPLVDPDGVSLVSGVSDEDAQKLEPVRQGMKPMIDALVAAGVERRRIALAWAFRTQTTQSLLHVLHALPKTLGSTGALADVPVYAADVTAALLPGLTVPKDHIGHIFTGTLPMAHLLTGPGTTLNPTAPQITKVPFTLVLPDATKVTPPAGGWPVTLFGHGLGGHRNQMFALADALAASGQAVIAIDHVFHGDRSTCIRSSAVTGAPSDDAACADPTTQRCGANGRCVAREAATRLDCSPGATGGIPGDLYCTQAGQGLCQADGLCEGGDFLRLGGAVAISGHAFIDTVNLFATRDHFRAPVADLAQLERVIRQTTTVGNLNQLLVAQGATGLNPDAIRYAGQSLGGILGTLFTSASPHVQRSLLNVPGADMAEVMLTAPAFAEQKAAFLGTLASQGITPGTPAYDEFIGLAKWILGPSDPQNAGYWMLNGMSVPTGRRVLLQYITGDLVIPNPTTEILLAATNRGTGVQADVSLFDPVLSDLPPADRHGFLMNFKHPATTAAAQAEAAAFLSTGATP